MNRLKKGDEVIITKGSDKGRRGTVVRVLEGYRVVVEGINMVKKHTKPNTNAGIQGGIVEQERSIHTSNVMLYNPVTGKGDRIGVKALEDGRRVRYYKSNNEVVDV